MSSFCRQSVASRTRVYKRATRLSRLLATRGDWFPHHLSPLTATCTHEATGARRFAVLHPSCHAARSEDQDESQAATENGAKGTQHEAECHAKG